MVRFWSYLITHGLIDLDGGRFGGRVKNWSPRRVKTNSGPGYSSPDS
jgi:hypothetical protein